MMEHLKISDWSALDNLEKKICSNCGRRRMYFCYDCKLYIPGVQNMVPQLKLPVHIDIIKHPQEKNSKSTALHCLLLAPTCTRLFDLTNVPNYNSTKYKQENTALVIQSENGISVHSFVKERGCIKRFVFLDSTWFQIGRLKSLSKIQSLPVITLRSYKTKYWRPQRGLTESHLATIEAIYYAVRELFEATSNEEYNGRFDNLLFWFFAFRSRIFKKHLQ